MTKLSEVRAGDVLVADEWFECLEPGEHVVCGDEHGLFLCCANGHHYLEAQAAFDGGGDLVGLRKVGEPW